MPDGNPENYSSTPGEDAINYFCQRLSEINFHYHGLTPEDIRSLLHVVLNTSYFQFEGMFFKQLKGLPMGNKISSLLADFYMDRIESPLIGMLVGPYYYRYVDDCLIITTSREAATEIYDIFNSRDRNIHFDMEHPDNNGNLSLLDFSLNTSQGSPIFRPYMKIIKKDIFIHGDTAIPSNMKQNIILNEWDRLKQRCDNMEDIEDQRTNFITKLTRNGHRMIPRISNLPRRRTHIQDGPIFYMPIPFIDDATNTMVKRALRGLGYNIRLSHRSRNLSNILSNSQNGPPTRNGRCNIPHCRVNNENCYKSMVVYQATCSQCSQFYIGSTKLFLHTRIRQHFTQRHSHIFLHNLICGGSWSFIVRQTFRSIQSMRWGESLIIRRDKPSLNTRENDNCLMSFLV
jgi:hypothetical protein